MNQVEKISQGKYVYIAESSTGEIKVGISKEPESRIRQFNTANPKEVDLARKIGPFENAAKVESAIHNQFEEHRVSGEWFTSECSDELQAFVDGLTTMGQFDGMCSPLQFLRDLNDWHLKKSQEMRRNNYHKDRPGIHEINDYFIEKFGLRHKECPGCERLAWYAVPDRQDAEIDECPYCETEL